MQSNPRSIQTAADFFSLGEGVNDGHFLFVAGIDTPFDGKGGIFVFHKNLDNSMAVDEDHPTNEVYEGPTINCPNGRWRRADCKFPFVKTQEVLFGTSDGDGEINFVFEGAYAEIPHIDVEASDNHLHIRTIIAKSETGCTVKVQRINNVLGLLPTYPVVVGQAVTVLITEK